MSKEEIADKIGVARSTVYRWLKGYSRAAGGVVARTIPAREIHKVQHQMAESPNVVAIRNATNACLVVADRTITLRGTIGEYLVEPTKKIITANIGGNLIDLDFDIISGLVEELKAIGRNLPNIAVGNEMW